MSLVNNTQLRSVLLIILFGIYLFIGIEESEGLLSIFVPVIIYPNPETDKSRILSDLKGKTGIYMWTHKQSSRVYIGSALDLSYRLSYYYTPSWLQQADNYISRALILHTHSAFCLSILNYIDISNLDKEKARLLILESEQFYLDLIFSLDESNTYNLLKVAGSSLGRTLSAKTKVLMSEAHKGKTHSTDTKALISAAMSGENHPYFGKIGKDHPMFGRTGKNHPMYGRTGENNSLSKKVFVYSKETPTTLSYKFASCTEAAIHFKCSVKLFLYISKMVKYFKRNGSYLRLRSKVTIHSRRDKNIRSVYLIY